MEVIEWLDREAFISKIATNLRACTGSGCTVDRAQVALMKYATIVTFSPMKWVRATDLDRWADTIGSRIALSEIVSSLIRASASDPTHFRFPKGDSAQIPGYDGSLIAEGAPPYVSEGQSVWEFGTESAFLEKAT